LSKKTLAIIIESGNDYMVGVKANQPRLMNAIEQLAQEHIPLDIDEDYERTRDRLTHRKVQVFNDVTGIDPDWLNVQSLIRVQRWGTRSAKPFESTSYFISSLSCDASRFAQGIRGHGDIENRLHWVKDVVLIEDASPFKVYNPATN
jgi:hypothetical protein